MLSATPLELVELSARRLNDVYNNSTIGRPSDKIAIGRPE